MKCFTVSLFSGLLACAGAVQHVSAAEAPCTPECVVYRFPGGTDGSGPVAGLLYTQQFLFGTTEGGGAGLGTVYKVDPMTRTETPVYSFHGGDGNDPMAGVIRGLYGTTWAGGNEGVNGSGTVFKLNFKTGTEKVIYSFGQNGTQDASSPAAGVIDVGNTLYGTSYFGGNGSCGDGCGTVYSIALTRPIVEKVVHSFQGGTTDGSFPDAGLLAVTDGEGNTTLYGTTSGGGVLDRGTLFSINLTTGTYQIVWSFCSSTGCTDGSAPDAGLIALPDAQGNPILYGTTSGGGTTICGGFSCDGGTVFSFDPASGQENVLYSFCQQYDMNAQQCLDGDTPEAGLVAVTDKTYPFNTRLYGTTERGGTFSEDDGTVFSYNLATGAETAPLYSFQGGSDGRRPVAGLTYVRGNLYGTTQQGGVDSGFGLGTVFEITPPK